tara:strand:+ start:1218 stop:1787 length:570 start_codon:yes stop_codon:yes gene_type:complete
MKLRYFTLIVSLILLDQFVKYIVHVNMPLHTEISIIGDFIKLYHIENPGMAFGINFDFKYTKLILSLFRLSASFLIGFYLLKLLDKKTNPLLLICISLILSGAIGNVIDSVFYGIIYNNAPYNAPFALFNGQVIDMFYIDIWEGYLSDWIPLLGGSYLSLWPVFNLADSYIFIGVAILLLNQNKLKLDY